MGLHFGQFIANCEYQRKLNRSDVTMLAIVNTTRLKTSIVCLRRTRKYKPKASPVWRLKASMLNPSAIVVSASKCSSPQLPDDDFENSGDSLHETQTQVPLIKCHVFCWRLRHEGRHETHAANIVGLHG